MPKLKDFEGQSISIVLFDAKNPKGLQQIIAPLISVDDAGIWIENQKVMNTLLESLKLSAVQGRVLQFLPYTAIHSIFVNYPGTTLSEKAFGA
jgi:hypothetical protein